jgi:hypothetical protein
MKRRSQTLTFTFVLQYGGYTAISQFRGGNEREAMSAWARCMSMAASPDSPKNLPKVAELVAADNPVKVKTVQNVWCVSASVRSKLALLNIVRTSVRDG